MQPVMGTVGVMTLTGLFVPQTHAVCKRQEAGGSVPGRCEPPEGRTDPTHTCRRVRVYSEITVHSQGIRSHQAATHGCAQSLLGAHPAGAHFLQYPTVCKYTAYCMLLGHHVNRVNDLKESDSSERQHHIQSLAAV